MNCKNCGNIIKPGNSFCEVCGTKVEEQLNQMNQQSQMSSNYQEYPNQVYQQPQNYSHNESYMNNQNNNKMNPILKIVIGLLILFFAIPIIYPFLFKFTSVGTQKVTFDGYEYKISKQYKVEVDGTKLNVYPKSKDYVTVTKINDNNFYEIKEAMDKNPTVFKSVVNEFCKTQGCVLNGSKKKIINGIEIYLFEMTQAEYTGYITYYPTPDSLTAMTIYMQKDGAIDEEAFENVMKELLELKKNN